MESWRKVSMRQLISQLTENSMMFVLIYFCALFEESLVVVVAEIWLCGS